MGGKVDKHEGIGREPAAMGPDFPGGEKMMVPKEKQKGVTKERSKVDYARKTEPNKSPANR